MFYCIHVLPKIYLNNYTLLLHILNLHLKVFILGQGGEMTQTMCVHVNK
jgi:hypothetical protein